MLDRPFLRVLLGSPGIAQRKIFLKTLVFSSYLRYTHHKCCINFPGCLIQIKSHFAEMNLDFAGKWEKFLPVHLSALIGRPVQFPIPGHPFPAANGGKHMSVKYIFVTGGVVSGLGKGITAEIGRAHV